ncbi:MAG: ABC transporter permease subunit [Bacillus subtilis]|nr:ABC transporter permease subunit [Bacillus subtilis]
MNKNLRFGFVAFGVFLVWLIASLWVDQDLVLPSPIQVGAAIVGLVGTRVSLMAIFASLGRLAIALTTSFVLGTFIGFLAGFRKGIQVIASPLATIFRTIPVVSIIVIVLMFFGFRFAPYVITFLMLFPISYQAALEGVSRVDSELVDVYKLEDHHFGRMLLHCYLPLMAGYLRTAMLQSAGLGVKVLVMAEYLAQTPDSIGNRLYLAKAMLEYDQVFAWTIVLIVIALLIETAINRSRSFLQKSPPLIRDRKFE